jgi:hypothetical protein
MGIGGIWFVPGCEWLDLVGEQAWLENNQAGHGELGFR